MLLVLERSTAGVLEDSALATTPVVNGPCGLVKQVEWKHINYQIFFEGSRQCLSGLLAFTMAKSFVFGGPRDFPLLIVRQI